MDGIENDKFKLDSAENTFKQIREAMGLSKGKFAEAIKATRQSVIRWENGQTEPALTIPQIKALQKEIRKLGLDFDDFPE